MKGQRRIKLLSKLSKKTKFALLGAGLYIIMPVDVIPDFFVGFGQVDDLAVATYLIKCLYEDLKKPKKEASLS